MLTLLDLYLEANWPDLLAALCWTCLAFVAAVLYLE